MSEIGVFTYDPDQHSFFYRVSNEPVERVEWSEAAKACIRFDLVGNPVEVEYYLEKDASDPGDWLMR